ncbi:hypothetical protein WJ67_04620 [Burkholderia ubonensis]|nr:hypothetical protein WJ67_04620 [Burkholderia ubonensis]KVO39552.1 hypothetical protein WJ75_08585 [Burkholderia ubonensis]
MRSGERRMARGAGRRATSPSRECGLAFLGVLIMIALIGIGTMETARIWSTTLRHERETQLLFVGDQFRAAIGRYYVSAPGSRYPASLDDLLDDKRAATTLRHLRRIYRDPLTGTTDWGIVKSPDGGIMGVYSKAPGAPLKQAGFAPQDAEFAGGKRYENWRFVYVPAKAADDKQAE